MSQRTSYRSDAQNLDEEGATRGPDISWAAFWGSYVDTHMGPLIAQKNLKNKFQPILSVSGRAGDRQKWVRVRTRASGLWSEQSESYINEESKRAEARTNIYGWE